MGIAETAATYVDARIDTKRKERAAVVFEAKVPNATTRKAIAELEAGKGKRFNKVDDLMAELHAGD